MRVLRQVPQDREGFAAQPNLLPVLPESLLGEVQTERRKREDGFDTPRRFLTEAPAIGPRLERIRGHGPRIGCHAASLSDDDAERVVADSCVAQRVELGGQTPTPGGSLNLRQVR